jgi:hypothetical protein
MAPPSNVEEIRVGMALMLPTCHLRDVRDAMCGGLTAATDQWGRYWHVHCIPVGWVTTPVILARDARG